MSRTAKAVEPCFDRDVLPMYVVYFSPSDFPGLYVVRRHEVRRPDGEAAYSTATTEYWTAATLDGARSRIPESQGYAVARSPEDDPCIVETWI